VSSYLNTWATRRIGEAGPNGNGLGVAGILRPKIGDEGMRIHAGVVAAAVTIGLSMLPKIKAQTRNTLVAAGVGMLTIPTINLATGLVARDNGYGGALADAATAIGQANSKLRYVPSAALLGRSSAYRSSSHYNSAAAFVGVPSKF